MVVTLIFFAIALLSLYALYSLGNSRSDQDPLSDFMNDKPKKYR